MGFGRDARTVVMALFSRNDVCDALATDARHKVNVAGRLTSGRYFYGSDTITIVSPKPSPWSFRRFRHY